MSEIQSALLIFGLFLLRIVGPLLIIAGLGYLLARLDERWKAEAEAERDAVSKPETIRRPGMPAPLQPTTVPTALLATPCWDVKECDPALRADCSAFRHQGIPCWMARMRAEETLPASCPTCPLFTQPVAHD